MCEVHREEKLGRLMYGLLYPAFLGSILVAIALRGTSIIGENHFVARLSLAGLFIGFFCASFAAFDEKTSYNKKAFLLDFIEVALMFWYFKNLGFLSETSDLSELTLAPAWIALVVIIPVQLSWRWAVGVKALKLFELRIVASLVLFVGLWNVDVEWSVPLACGLSLICVCLYVFEPQWYKDVRSRLFA